MQPQASLLDALLEACGGDATEVEDDLSALAAARGLEWPKLRDQIARGDAPWWLIARPDQFIPPGDWRIAYWMGGRGSGKTRSICENFAELIARSPGKNWGVVAPTFGTARDVDIEGPSGLLKALDRRDLVQRWNRSNGELLTENGGRIKIDGADDGAVRIQGENLAGCLCDEIGLWRTRNWQMAWRESIQFALRIAPAKIIAGGTPKRGHPLVKHVLAHPNAIIRRMRTMDNRANLDRATLQELLDQYEGTTLGRQELEGEFLEDAEGALWKREWLERHRVAEAPATRLRCVVAIDPAVTVSADSDETGIVTACCDENRHGYVLSDLSGKMSPQQWAWKAVQEFYRWEADYIAAEVNQGGDLVRDAIRQVDPDVPVKMIRAKRGKALRAQPIALMYEQGRVHHAGVLPGLEEQMLGWDPDASADSPDRVDAVVYAVGECMLRVSTPSAGWA